MTDSIPADVAAALDHAGLRARAIREITTIRFANLRRATYRIDLDSGDVIKARRLEDEASAGRLFETRRCLPDAFTAAIDCHGAVLLERWVHGRPLGDTRPNHRQLTEAAALLSGLHATRFLAGQRLPGDDSTSVWRAKTDAGLRALTAARVLSEPDAERLRVALDRSDPGRAAAGLCHFDFCGQNMAVDDLGRLRVFDNERVGIGLLGFDLARAEYRWRLQPEDWAAFLRAYSDAAAVPDPHVGLDFWGAVVLVHSACLRLHAEPSHLLAPVDGLRRLAEAASGAAR